eukprot:3307129-Rhodomonas_salina.1
MDHEMLCPFSKIWLPRCFPETGSSVVSEVRTFLYRRQEKRKVVPSSAVGIPTRDFVPGSTEARSKTQNEPVSFMPCLCYGHLEALPGGTRRRYDNSSPL